MQKKKKRKIQNYKENKRAILFFKKIQYFVHYKNQFEYRILTDIN